MITIRGYNRVRSGGYNRVMEVIRESSDMAVTLAEAKQHLKVDFTDDDAYITILIKAAQAAMEAYTGLSLVPTEITAYLHNDISGMDIPFGPVISDVSVSADDVDLTTDDFVIRGERFPILLQSYASDIKLTYEAGYDSDTLPADLKLAVLNEIAYRYEHRGDNAVVMPGLQSVQARSLAGPHRKISWIA